MSNLSSIAGSSATLPEAERISLFLFSDWMLFGSFILATLIIYDSILTFDKEVEFIWYNLRSSTSWIFLLNRYLGIASAVVGIFGHLFTVDNFKCQLLFWLSTISGGITILLFDYILLQRVLALYCRSKTISGILFALLSMEFVIGLVLDIYTGTASNDSVELLSNNAAICIESVTKKDIIISEITWALPITTGLIFMILSLYKSMQYRKESLGTDGYSLIGLLLRDQAAYFLVLVISSLAEIMTPSFSSVVVQVILETIGRSTIPCMIGSRLIINLKVDGKARADGGTNTGTELPTVEFASARSDVSEYGNEDIA